MYGLEDVIRLVKKIDREAGLGVGIQRYKPVTNTGAMEAAMGWLLGAMTSGSRNGEEIQYDGLFQHRDRSRKQELGH